MVLLALGAAIVGAVVGIAKTAVSVCTAIGGWIGRVILPHIEEIARVLETVVNVISACAQIFAGKPEEEKPEEMGMKAQLAAEQGVKPENFDTIDEYLAYLRTEIQLDEKRMEGLSDIERNGYKTVGLALYVEDIKERTEMELNPDFYTLVGRAGMTAVELKALIEEMKRMGIYDGETLVRYISGTLEPGCEEQSKVYTAIRSAFRESNPDLSHEEIMEKVYALEDAAQVKEQP